MKKITLLLLVTFGLLSITQSLQAQTIPQNPNLTDSEGKRQGKWTILYDANWTIITDATKAVFYRLIEYKDDKPTGTVTDHYRNGTVQMEATLLADRPEDIMDGTVTFYDAQGKKEAEQVYKNGQLVSEESFLDPESWGALNQAGMQAYQIGDYQKAIEFLEKAKVQAEKESGKEHPDYATSLNNLALLYQAQGDYPKAEPLYKQALEIYRKVLGEMHPDFALSLNSLAVLYQAQGDYPKAEPLFKQALEIRRKVLGEMHPYFAQSLNNLAVLYQAQGDYPKAEPLFKQALEINRKVLGEMHPNFALSLNNLAFLYQAQGDYPKAEPLYKQASQVLIGQTETNFTNLSEKEKGLFLETFKYYFEIYHSFALKAQKPELAGWLYDNTLAVKGLLFQSNQKIRERVMASNDEALKSLFKDWQNQREYLSAIYQLSTAEKERRQINQAQEEAKANALEKQLSAQSEFFATALDNQQVKWQEVQQQLKKGEAVIEINRIRYHDKKWTDSVLYVALILKPESKQPEMVVLPNGTELEKKYISYYSNVIKNKRADKYSYAQFWQRLAASLVGTEKVYLSPDGVYHQINLETLKNPITDKYLGEEIALQLIGSSRDLVKKKPSGKQFKNAVLFGYPDYNNTPDSTASEQAPILALTRGIDNESLRFFDGNKDITPLEGTKKEVEAITKKLRQAKIDTKVYLGKEASEPSLKAIDFPDILHIATHGFFLPNIAQDTSKYLGMDKKTASENPLLRSGLLMSYAKTAFQKGGDGVLTAYEAMNLRLDNTELVVLSACETGLGEINNGEGVYGLQRSFQQAGARAVLMSLWTVSDEATQEMMTLFYDNLLSKKQSKREAFKNAQSTLRQKYPEPYYWGAFVMVGE